MNMHKSDADIMAEAREYIEKNGWWRGALRGPNGRQVCGLGGLIYSQGWNNRANTGYLEEYREDTDRIIGKVFAVALSTMPLKEQIPFPHILTDFTVWNDKVAKDKQEVLDAFAKAEKIERAGYDPDAP